MTRQDLVNKSIDKLNTVKEALELINILEYDECIAVLTGTKNLPSEIHSALMRRGKEANGGKTNETAEVVTRESAEETNTELLQSIDKKLDMLLAAQTATQAAKEE